MSRNFGGGFRLAHEISLAYNRKILVSRLSNNATCVDVIGCANSCKASTASHHPDVPKFNGFQHHRLIVRVRSTAQGRLCHAV